MGFRGLCTTIDQKAGRIDDMIADAVCSSGGTKERQLAVKSGVVDTGDRHVAVCVGVR